MRRLERSSFVPPLRQRDVGELRVSTSTYAGSLRLPRHEHGGAYLCLVASGAYRQTVAGRQDECRRGMLLVHPPGHCHANQFHPQGGRSLDIFLAESWLQHDDIRHLLAEYRLLHLPNGDRLRRRIESELRACDAAAGLALESCVLELLAQSLRHEATPQPPVWMGIVLERLHDHPQQTPKLRELAALAGVHPAHLARTFRRLRGISVGEYQRNLRVTIACQTLRNPSSSIATIAADAGFSDQSHFARVFRRVMGQSPGEYRRAEQIRYR